MREHGPLIWLPTVEGTASQWPSGLARYSTIGVTAPFSLISCAMISSTGSRLRAWSAGCQLGKREDVVARSRLPLGGDGDQQLVALRGNVVDLDLDLFFFRPFVDQGRGRAVGARHPMIPEAMD